MNPTHQINTLRPLVLVIACLAAGASWAQVTVDVVVDPVTVADPVVAARQQEMALQLARANLSQQGITDPTTGQLALATSDVQALRDNGLGWGQIANSLGLRLGAVVSAANRADKTERLAAVSATTTRPATAGSQAKGGNSGNSNAGSGQGAGGSGNRGGGSNAGGGNAGGNSGNGGKGGNSGNGGGNGGGKGGGKR